MATEYNKQTKSKYPRKTGKRDLKVIEQNGVAVLSAETYTIRSKDNIRFVRNTGASTVNLPPAAENVGRAISFIQVNAAVLTIDGYEAEQVNGGATFVDLDAADDNATIVSDGSAWLVVASSIA